MSLHILVLQGPNLDRLGQREPGIYGSVTLGGITDRLDVLAPTLGARLRHVQSAREGVLVESIHAAADDGLDGILVNAAAYTHTSVALRDALVAARLPFVEVHLSNIHAREAFRHRSLLADVAVGMVTGFGAFSYELGLRGLVAEIGRP